jgi:hypothetical protein
MESPEKLIEDLLAKLELDKLEEFKEEEPEPGLVVTVMSECTVELPSEIRVYLKPKFDLG